MDTRIAAPRALTFPSLSSRDRAVLRAVAAGRCRISHHDGDVLVVDGLCFADQFAGPRLAAAGLITDAGSGAAQLTPSGQAVLAHPAGVASSAGLPSPRLEVA